MSRGRGRRPAGRGLTERVKTAKGRKSSSTRWLRRQLNDPYVAEAKRLGYPSRAAFKLIDLDERFHILGPGMRVVDLGAAPGGWTRVAAEKVLKKGGGVIALDLAEMAPVAGAKVLRADFLDPATPELLIEALGGTADLVLSDMAPPATGHRATDQIRIIALCEAALEFAGRVLAPGGAFVAKVFQGGAGSGLVAEAGRLFASVRHAKPPSSRPESSEFYLVARGFKGTGNH